MISFQNLVHNMRRSPVISLPLILLLFAAGCSSNDDSQGTSQTAEKINAGTGLHLAKPECSTVIETRGWEVFSELGRRATAGENISDTDIDKFGNEPALTLWVKTNDEFTIDPKLLGFWIKLTFWDEMKITGPKKEGPIGNTMSQFYRYSFDNTDRINTFINDYSSNQQGCRLLELAEKWLPTEILPLPLTLHFFPGKAEIRLYESHLLIDTGAAVAARPAQLNRQIVSLLHRNYQSVPGENPIELQGTLALTNSLRTLCNEGIANWIGDMPNIYFDRNHPTLGAFEIVHEDLFHGGRKVINMFNNNIPGYMQSEAKLQSEAKDFARSLAASKSFTKGGYAMAATIAGHLGEGRLIQEKSSVSGFISAFQEAALLNPVPLPRPGEAGVENYQTVPPFSADVFDWLLEILAAEGF